MTVLYRDIWWDQDLTVDFAKISGMAATFTVDKPSIVWLSGYIDTHHRGLVDAAVMVAFKSRIDGSWMDGSTTGENILSETDHYGSSVICGYAEVDAGEHTVELLGRSASTAAPDTGGLAEVKGNYNCMLVHIEPA